MFERFHYGKIFAAWTSSHTIVVGKSKGQVRRILIQEGLDPKKYEIEEIKLQ